MIPWFLSFVFPFGTFLLFWIMDTGGRSGVGSEEYLYILEERSRGRWMVD